MPTILKIGYQEYLVKNPNDAIPVLKAMANAVRMRSAHIAGRYVYFPEEDIQCEVSMTNITNSQIYANDPREVKPKPTPKLIEL